MQTRIYTVGTYDLFHIGHLRLLQAARALGDFLIVGVDTDELCGRIGKRPVIPFGERFEIIKSLRCVDIVIPQYNREDRERVIQELGVSIFVMGDDHWDDPIFHPRGCETVMLPYYQATSTSKIKEELGR